MPVSAASLGKTRSCNDIVIMVMYDAWLFSSVISYK